MTSGVIFLFYSKRAVYACAFVFGGTVYGAVETLWRGHTHPTMLLVGGVCFAVMYGINTHFRPRTLAAALIGCTVITSAELLSGCIFNLWLGLDVWDYSGMRCNLFGQICLRYSVYWALLSMPAFRLCGILEKAVYSASAAPASSSAENSSSSL